MKFNFSPSKEFEKKAKARFLAVFDAHYPAPAHPRASEFILAMRALAVVLGCAAVVFGGASVYAETKNVPADNPLYPLKRLSESVQLALTAPSAKPQLEASLAARRADEITDIAERHPSSTLISHLTNDLNTAVDASISGADEEARKGRGNGNAGDGNASAVPPFANTMSAPLAPSASNASSTSSTTPSFRAKNNQDHGDNGNDLQKVCGTLQSFLNPSSSVVEGGFLRHSDAFKRFQDRCGPGVVSSTAMTATSTVPVSDTTTSTSTFRRFPSGGRNDSDTSPVPPTLRRGNDNESEIRFPGRQTATTSVELDEGANP